MTIRPRAVRALRNARERLRDAAAGEHAAALSARNTAATDLAAQQAQLAAYLEAASQKLSDAESVYELDRVAEHTGVHRLAVDDANAAVENATVAAERRADELRVRARQLRSIERVLDRVEHALERRETRNEQRSQDDLVGARAAMAKVQP